MGDAPSGRKQIENPEEGSRGGDAPSGWKQIENPEGSPGRLYKQWRKEPGIKELFKETMVKLCTQT